MLSVESYIRLSLENNLFWSRIMKEHAAFIQMSIPSNQMPLAIYANQFKQQYDKLLAETIELSDGIISEPSIQSGQYYTQYTEAAEQITQQLTGIRIDRNLTMQEYNIQPSAEFTATELLERRVSTLNQLALNQTLSFSRFKSDLYNSQASCRLFTFLYASVLEHMSHEADRYVKILTGLQDKNENFNLDYESFWNTHMSDHAKVMRGLFDPTEAEYFNEADRFAKVFDKLIKEGSANKEEELVNTKALSEFKSKTTRAILECKVKSLMSPLFTDHIYREANHYIYHLSND